ncbi:unnamed protein product [Pedinophyceae sp. YPF-701]|nr:unnamed protein product [Pedinophyceae sp. YPF-701]
MSLRASAGPLSASEAELIGDELLCMGAVSVSVEEYRPDGIERQKIYGAGAGLWDACQVVATFPLGTDVAAAWGAAATVLGPDKPAPDIAVEAVYTEEWIDAVKQEYKPVEVSPGMWIVPAGGDAGAAAGADMTITLEPGMAFGTGEHPTTRLCLGYLRRATRPGDVVMDYGAGSGVLAIACVLLGAKRAVCVDVDPFAVRAAAINAEWNGVAASVRSIVCGAGPEDPEPMAAAGLGDGGGAFTLVAANILQGPLEALAGRLGWYAAPGARLVLSGILEEQARDVMRRYAAEGFEGFEVEVQGGWACVTARKKA